MPGKPAARLTDMTAHGGTIVGPGVPTVLIGKMPAATLGDMHVCPMMTPATPPIPHVGGPITLGSTGVFIGGKPAARMGDMAVCVGPPSSIILGCMTVMIGEAGSGSQAGPAGSASAAKSASMKGTKSVAPMDPPPYQTTQTQNHFVDVLVQDKKKRPLSGMVYKLKDPLGVHLPGATTTTGKIHHEGYAAAGSYEVQILSLANAKWSSSKVEFGKPVDLSVDCDGIEDGTDLVFHLTAEIDGKTKIWFLSLPSTVHGKKGKASWTMDDAQLDTLMAGHVGEITGLTFLAVCHSAGAASGKLEVEADRVYTFVDSAGKPRAKTDVEIETKAGKIEKATTDENGKVDLGKGRVGRHGLGQGNGRPGRAGANRKSPLGTEPKYPGDKFRTIKSAMIAGLKAAFKATKESADTPEKRVEFGGWIVSLKAGGYTYTPLIRGENTGDERAVKPGPRPENAVGLYHSHPRNTLGLSGGDADFSAANGVPISVISPDGTGEVGECEAPIDRQRDRETNTACTRTPLGKIL